jgi:hypothetical protein
MNGDPRSPPAREDAGPPAEHPDGAAMRAARQASPHTPVAFPLGLPISRASHCHARRLTPHPRPRDDGERTIRLVLVQVAPSPVPSQ